MEDTAVKPFPKQDKEISSSSSDSNNFLYIYIIIQQKISISTPELWEVQGILLTWGT